tara:strand:+ start:182 stop:895 length:714 start_codon:yes stop_codon:yes gene_type:complete
LKKKKISRRINFSRSSLYWEGESSGIFDLISVLKIYHENKIEIFGLSQSVLAGNMYKKNNLLKEPPYLFQVAGSNYQQTIFRSKILTNKKSTLRLYKSEVSDTSGKPLFKIFKLKLTKESSINVNKYISMKSHFKKNNFSAKIKLNINKSVFFLEFPINHFNINSKKKMWQAETGPVLFPFEIKNKNSFKFLPTFVHFNSFDKVEVFYDYPFGNRLEKFHNNKIIQKFKCKINIFSA